MGILMPTPTLLSGSRVRLDRSSFPTLQPASSLLLQLMAFLRLRYQHVVSWRLSDPGGARDSDSSRVRFLVVLNSLLDLTSLLFGAELCCSFRLAWSNDRMSSESALMSAAFTCMWLEVEQNPFRTRW